MVDTSAIGRHAAEAMETIETHEGETTVRTVAIIVEVDRGEETALIIRSTEDRAWALEAFLATTLDWFADQRQRTRDGEEGE